MKSNKVSELTTNRLSIYLRCLNLLAAEGIKTVSSQSLADQFNLNSAQIRKDLAYFGEFGVRGVGYFIDDLRQNITLILGLDCSRRVGIVGAGNLGTALANYNGFTSSNFTVVALFDNDPQKVGQHIGHNGGANVSDNGSENSIAIYDVRHIARVVREKEIDVAVIAVPARAAQGVLNLMMTAGVKAVLNFAPVRLRARHGVKIKYVDLTISLESLSYFLAQPQAARITNPPDQILHRGRRGRTREEQKL